MKITDENGTVIKIISDYGDFEVVIEKDFTTIWASGDEPGWFSFNIPTQVLKHYIDKVTEPKQQKYEIKR